MGGLDQCAYQGLKSWEEGGMGGLDQCAHQGLKSWEEGGVGGLGQCAHQGLKSWEEGGMGGPLLHIQKRRVPSIHSMAWDRVAWD